MNSIFVIPVKTGIRVVIQNLFSCETGLWTPELGVKCLWVIISLEARAWSFHMKYNFRKWWLGLTVGQQDAYLNKLEVDLGGETKAREVLEAYSRGEIKLVFQDNTVKFVDVNGRVIPIKLKGKVVDANRSFHLVQPEIDYTAIMARLLMFFGVELMNGFMDVEKFEREGKAIIARAKADKQTNNLLKGVHLPICFPKLAVSDYGRTFEEIFLAAAARSYCDAFPGRTFTNHRKGDLAGKVSVVNGTRHERLVEAMAKGSVTGVFFPTAFQGYGIEADREAIKGLPNNYLLTGALDTSVAMVAFPQVLARDYYTPGLDCAANSWGSGISLFFRPGGSGLSFGDRGLGAYVFFSGGVFVLGQ